MLRVDICELPMLEKTLCFALYYAAWIQQKPPTSKKFLNTSDIRHTTIATSIGNILEFFVSHILGCIHEWCVCVICIYHECLEWLGYGWPLCNRFNVWYTFGPQNLAGFHGLTILWPHIESCAVVFSSDGVLVGQIAYDFSKFICGFL